MKYNQTINIPTSIEIYDYNLHEIAFYIYLKNELIGRIKIEKNYQQEDNIDIKGILMADTISKEAIQIDNYELFLNDKYLKIFKKVLIDKDYIYDMYFDNSFNDNEDGEEIVFYIFFEHLEHLVKELEKKE